LRYLGFRVVVLAFALGTAACAKHYTTTGLILKLDRPGSIVTI